MIYYTNYSKPTLLNFSVTAGECKYDDLVRFANKEEVILKKTHKK